MSHRSSNSCSCGASEPPAPPRLDVAALRAKLARESGGGPLFWRSLEEAADTPDFRQWLQREFPPAASELPDGPSRRQFLKIMAASLGLAGLAACTRQPRELILPYVKQPEDLVLGVPLQYATAMTLGGYATGLLVESHEGRPTKIEGNPDHPMSLGAASVFHQASVLELYDPDRSRTVLRAGETSSWEEFLADLVPALAEQSPKQGAGLRLLTETVTSPTLAAQIGALLARYPKAAWHQYEPWNRDNLHSGQAEPHYDFSKAAVIVALDSDFLFGHPASLAYARQFAQGRTIGDNMSRLYVAEPTPTITGSMADHRLACGGQDIALLALALAGAGEVPASLSGAQRAWVAAVRKDLAAHKGTSLIVAGESQPPAVQQAAYALNEAWGNPGQTVVYRKSVAAQPVPQTQSLRALADAMHAGEVELLVQIGGNPAYDAPADLDFAGAMARVKRHVHLGLFYHETAQRCQWHLPQAHYLESWGDALAFDGTACVLQPLIQPLYDGRTAYELLDALLLEQSTRSAYDAVRSHWQGTQTGESFEQVWRKTVHDGLALNTAAQEQTPPVFPTASAAAEPANGGSGSLEIVFRPDPAVWDGRFSNNGWLQELPKPLTKLTWDNAALISPKLAERMKLNNEDVVELSFQGRQVHAPVWIMPGQAENSVTLHLGYGRTGAGHVGDGQGVNAYALRTSDAMFHGAGLKLKKIEGQTWRLAATQEHFSLAGRDDYRTGSLAEYRQHPDFASAEADNPAVDDTLYPPDHTYPNYAWGMTVDLNTCISCNACVIACQAENNIPIVGKGQVINGREMHWIRVDSYYKGDADNPEMYHQPVPCMQCENAPCEVVCPVAATVHSPEGLNEQVYNRCIGTRYCSNNCPYKVRRFNFVQWPDNTTLSMKMVRNPDVTVRSRGVMEKCTYCVQRINEAKITSEKEDRQVRDGEILTACQQTCPTAAIVFGNINDPKSRVSRLKRQSRNYGMLAELNTRPRTTYLARVTNPNPEMAS